SETSGPAAVSLFARRARARLRGLGYRECPESEVAPEALLRVDMFWSLATGLGLVDTVRGADFQTSHLRLALEACEAYRVARAFALEAAYGASAGSGGRRAERLATRATEIAERLGNPHAIGVSLIVRAVMAFRSGAWAEARDLSEYAEQVFRERC